MANTVRPMQEHDLDQVMRIELIAFPTPWSRQSYQGELVNQFANYFVIEVEGQIGAYAGIWCVFEDAHITNVAVAPEYRRQGLGRKLMEALLAQARAKGCQRVLLEVRPSNLAAINLYRGFGFLPGGVPRGYYTDNQRSALFLVKYLDTRVPFWGCASGAERKG